LREGPLAASAHNIRNAWVNGQEVEIRDGQHYFRVHLKVTFVLD
jgi:hypothetical protein